MRILVTGGNGQLGKSIQHINSEHILLNANRKDLNVLDKKSIEKNVKQYLPDYVFHFASLTKGDECAKNPSLAYDINVKGTNNVVSCVRKYNIPLLFVSTNEVFDGSFNKPYSEDDIPNPISVAGKTKFEAENIIKNNIKNYLIIRTMWLYSKWSNNFLQAIVTKAIKKEPISLVIDEFGSPTNSYILSEAILKLIGKKTYGIYHITNDGITNRFGFGVSILKYFDYDIKTVKRIQLDSFERISRPPRYSVLSTNKINSTGIKLPKWNTSLKKFLQSEYEK